jgi:DNA-binding LacI/PurR family transcriptional regulator
MSEFVTRNAVAKRAGVSSAVVSYVINESNYVSEEKRRRVLDAIEELGYYPNFLARGLKTNKSSQIAFICDSIDNEWMGDIESLLFSKGYYVSVLYSRKNEELLRMLVQRQYEGIFMMTNVFTTSQLNSLAKNIPMVLYKTRNYGELDASIVTVAPNYYDGVKKSVEHLALKDHKRIALIPPLRYQTKGVKGDDFRAKAYVETLMENNLAIDERLICITTETMETVKASVYGMLTDMRAKSGPTGFVICNDYLAARVMQFIKKMNLRIPEDIAIVGTDNTNIAEITSPALTSVDFCKKELAQKVAQTLLALIAGEQIKDTYLDVSLVVREST